MKPADSSGDSGIDIFGDLAEFLGQCADRNPAMMFPERYRDGVKRYLETRHGTEPAGKLAEAFLAQAARITDFAAVWRTGAAEILRHDLLDELARFEQTVLLGELAQLRGGMGMLPESGLRDRGNDCGICDERFRGVRERLLRESLGEAREHYRARGKEEIFLIISQSVMGDHTKGRVPSRSELMQQLGCGAPELAQMYHRLRLRVRNIFRRRLDDELG